LPPGWSRARRVTAYGLCARMRLSALARRLARADRLSPAWTNHGERSNRPIELFEPAALRENVSDQLRECISLFEAGLGAGVIAIGRHHSVLREERTTRARPWERAGRRHGTPDGPSTCSSPPFHLPILPAVLNKLGPSAGHESSTWAFARARGHSTRRQLVLLLSLAFG